MAERFILASLDTKNNRNPLAKELGIRRNKTLLVILDGSRREQARITRLISLDQMKKELDAIYKKLIWGRKDLQEHVLTFAPLTAEREQQIQQWLKKLSDRRFAVRERADEALRRLGALACIVAESHRVADAEAARRLQNILRDYGSLHRPVTAYKLDHHIPFLLKAGESDPRLLERLRRILPLEAPDRGLASWWRLHTDRYSWSVRLDRFVAKKK